LPVLVLGIPLILGGLVGFSVINLLVVMGVGLFWPDGKEITVLFAFFVALLVAGYAVIRIYRLASRRMDHALVTWINRVQDLTADRLGCPSCDDVPLLAVRTRRDEAGGWLRTYAALANLPFVLWSPRIILTGLVIIVVLSRILRFFSYVMTPHDPGYDRPEMLLGSILGVVAAPIFVLAIAFFFAQVWMLIAPKLIRAHRLVFGGETFLDNLFTRITALPWPNQKCFDAPPPFRVPAITDRWPFVGFRHIAIYHNEEVLAFCAQWITARPSTSRASRAM